MRILVTNDDGIYAQGLLALVQTLSEKHEVFVAAPDSERSGTGHAFTYTLPLRARKVALNGFDGEAFAISGTPVDCVKLGAYNLMETLPDMVLSGINSGANLGSDVLYSGTASAALEGGILGIPSIAFSLASDDPKNYVSAARYSLLFIDYLNEHPLPDTCVLNVNVPDVPQDEIKGIKLCPLSRQMYNNKYLECVDPRGNTYYWIPSERFDSPSDQKGTDADYVNEGFVSVTPLTYMITATHALDAMRSHALFAR